MNKIRLNEIKFFKLFEIKKRREREMIYILSLSCAALNVIKEGCNSLFNGTTSTILLKLASIGMILYCASSSLYFQCTSSSPLNLFQRRYSTEPWNVVLMEYDFFFFNTLLHIINDPASSPIQNWPDVSGCQATYINIIQI